MLWPCGRAMKLFPSQRTSGRFGNIADANLTVIPIGITQYRWNVSIALSTITDEGLKQYITDGFYDFQAVAIYAYTGKNIIPSYQYLKECYPQTDSNNQDLFNLNGTVKDWSTITFLKGVAFEDCYGTTPGICKSPTSACPEGSTLAENTFGTNLQLGLQSTLVPNPTALRKRIAHLGPVLFRTTNEFSTVRQGVDCATEITQSTSQEDCPCPEQTDAAAYAADPRTQQEGDICYIAPSVPDPTIPTASGSTHAFWSVIAAAMLIPLLSMW
ncbi:MAG: hypothetical protein EZS28_006717 [Streblomastix strix]|uniref:Uncharacterized protein n=1 Tax=Streblomastix strix TaxID=222440 RepID=A0A5J4WS61_9EUKA|nr:MAG: hypothetical protein EZS28_006717 [Streblomastix strix]